MFCLLVGADDSDLVTRFSIVWCELDGATSAGGSWIIDSSECHGSLSHASDEVDAC